jgi:hypothetical protein
MLNLRAILRRKSGSVDWLLVGLLGLSLTVNVVQYSASPSIPRSEQLEVGTKVPAFDGKTLEGQSIAISPSATVLYLFSPSCVWSERNQQNAEYLSEQLPSGYSFVPVALTAEGVREFLAAKGLEWSVIVPGADTAKAYHLSVTPTTIVVKEDGVIEHVWIGAYSGHVARSIENAFALELPGLQQ